MSAEVVAPDSAEPTKPKFRLHWHVMLTHFPVSAFTGAFLFMAMHLVLREECWSRASFVALLLGTVVLVPVTATGWQEWRTAYRSFMNKVFRYKIRTAVVMVPLSIALTVYQALGPFEPVDLNTVLHHVVYFTGLGLLMLGSMAEGYFGGRLHHR